MEMISSPIPITGGIRRRTSAGFEFAPLCAGCSAARAENRYKAGRIGKTAKTASCTLTVYQVNDDQPPFPQDV